MMMQRNNIEEFFPSHLQNQGTERRKREQRNQQRETKEIVRAESEDAEQTWVEGKMNIESENTDKAKQADLFTCKMFTI